MSKITEAAAAKLSGRALDSTIVLTLRTECPFDDAQVAQLVKWGGQLLYDSGIMAIVKVSVINVADVANWDNVLEIV